MNAAEILDKVFYIYKQSFSSQVGLSLCVWVFVFSASFFASPAIMILMIGYYSNANLGFNQMPISLVFVGIISLWLFIISVNICISSFSFLAWQAFSNKRPDMSNALSSTVKSMLQIITVSIAQLIIIIPLIFLYYFIAYSVYTLLNAFSNLANPAEILSLPNAILFFVIALLCFFITMIVYNLTALAVPIAIFDRKHFFNAIIDSYNLMKGEFWLILGVRTVFLGTIVIVIFSFTTMSWVLLSVLMAFIESFAPNLDALMMLSSMVLVLINIMSYILVLPLVCSFTSIIFFNQKTKKEGLDLAIKLETLERANGL